MGKIKDWIDYHIVPIYVISVLFLFVFLFFYGYNFQEHNLFASDRTRLKGWCENHAPLRNYSDNPNVEHCFGDIWEEYRPIWEKRCKKVKDEECISESLNPKRKLLNETGFNLRN